MTRELKLALIVGFSLVLVVAVLISDHFSAVRRGNLSPIAGDDPGVLTMVGKMPEKVDHYTPFEPLKPTEETKSRAAKGSGDQSGTEIPQGGSRQTTSPIDPKTGGPFMPGLLPATTPDRDYAVQEGDTLYKVAKKTYGDAALHTKLAEYNNLTDGKGLKIGQKLVLPAKEVLEGKASPYVKPATMPIGPAIPGRKTEGARVDSPELKAMATTVVYKVQPGDTLSAIGRKTGATVKSVLELNPGLAGREDQLTVGQELKVPKGR